MMLPNVKKRMIMLKIVIIPASRYLTIHPSFANCNKIEK